MFDIEFGRHTGDTGLDTDNYYDQRNRYSLSDMISHIKRSIPDLRSIKHQPLENKESPCGSPKHIVEDSVAVNLAAASTSGGTKLSNIRMPSIYPVEGGFEKDTDIVTLQTTCTCAPKMGANDNLVAMQHDKNIVVTDDLDETVAHSSSGHHHHHYQPYQHPHQQQPQTSDR